MTHVDVLSNTIQGNVATAHAAGSSGGGIYILGFKAYLSGNRIEGDDAAPSFGEQGGGYVAGNTEAHLTRNTIISNTSVPAGTGFFVPGGGMLVNASGPITLSNNLIADNGDSVVVWKYVDLMLQNNLIAGHTVGVTNTAPASSTVAADTNLFWNTSDPLIGVNAIQQEPLLAPDYHLQPGSPAVDAGLTIPRLEVDLEGNHRPQGDKYDLGALEKVGNKVFLPLVTRGFWSGGVN